MLVLCAVIPIGALWWTIHRFGPELDRKLESWFGSRPKGR